MPKYYFISVLLPLSRQWLVLMFTFKTESLLWSATLGLLEYRFFVISWLYMFCTEADTRTFCPWGGQVNVRVVLLHRL